MKEKELVVFKGAEQAVLKRMVEAFKDNLNQEAEIDKEARKLLTQHQKEIDGGSLNYNKLFLMMRKKIAKERGFVL